MDKNEYEQMLDAQLREWDARIKLLQAKADKAYAKEEAKDEIKKKVTELMAKRNEAERKLKGVKDASGAAWEELKSGVDAAFEDFKTSVDQAVSRFSNVVPLEGEHDE